MRLITISVILGFMIAANSTVDDFDARLTCEEFYMEREFEDDDEELEEDEDELEDDDDEDDDDDDDDEDEDEDEDEWEDIEDDVTDCFDCDGTVSGNGFAQLFDMERRGYFV